MNPRLASAGEPLTISSVLVVGIFGAVIFWFVLRAIIKRKTTSAALATMALGFPCYSLGRMGAFGPVASAVIEWCSIAVGLFVLVSVVAAEHLFSPQPPKQ